MEANQNLELHLGRGFPLGLHKLDDLISGPELSDSIEMVRQGIVSSVGMRVAFLLASPMKELCEGELVVGRGGRRGDPDDFREERSRDSTEFSEVGEYRGTPFVAVTAEGVEDIACEWGERRGEGGGWWRSSRCRWRFVG